MERGGTNEGTTRKNLAQIKLCIMAVVQRIRGCGNSNSSTTVHPIGTATQRKTKAIKSVGRIKLEALCLAVTIYACFLFPLICIFYGINSLASSRVMRFAALGSNFVVSGVFMFELYFDIKQAERSGLLYVFGSVRVMLGTLSSVIPWGLIAYLAGGDDVFVTLAFMLVFSRVIRLPHYMDSAVRMIQWVIPRPPAPMVRLGALAISLILMMNLFGGLYFMSGLMMFGTDAYTWLDKDELRNMSWPINADDDLSPQARRYARSVYFVFQSLLTIGYGDVSPEHPANRVIVAGACLAGVFFMAVLIANMTSLFVNMDVTSAQHRANVDVVETLMGENKTPYETRNQIRRALRYQWVNFRGVSMRRILDQFPHSIVDGIAEQELSKLQNLHILRCLANENQIFHPAAHFVLENCTRVQIEAGQLLRNQFAYADHGPMIMLVMRGIAQKAIIGLAAASTTHEKRLSLIHRRVMNFAVRGRVSAVGATASAAINSSDPLKGEIIAGNEGNSNADTTVDHSVRSSSVLNENKMTLGDSPNNVLDNNLADGARPRVSQSKSAFQSMFNRTDSNGAARSSFNSGEHELEKMVHDAKTVAYHAKFPAVLDTGASVGAEQFFGVTEIPPALYRAQLKCEVLFLTQVDLRKINSLFPELGLNEVVRVLGSGTSCIGHDRRVDNQIEMEWRPRAGKNEITDKALEKIQKNANCLKREDDRSEIASRRWWNMEPHGKMEIGWDLIALLVITYNSFLIPLRVSQLNSTLLLDASLSFSFLDLLGDVFLIANSFLKPKLMRFGKEASERRRGGMKKGMAIVHTRSFQIRNHAVMKNQDELVIEQMVAIQKTQAQKDKWKHKVRYLRLTMEICLVFISLASLASLIVAEYALSSDEAMRFKQIIIMLRAPFIVRTFMAVELLSLLSKHALKRHEINAANKRKSLSTRIDVAVGGVVQRTARREKAHDIEPKYLSAKLGVGFIMVLHWIACVGMTLSEGFGGEYADDMEKRLQFGDRYVLGVYWALTTMTTVGFGDIYPTDSVYSLWTSALAFMGVLVYATCISILGLLFKDVALNENNVNHHRMCLTAYMLDREISYELQSRVLEFLEYVEVNDLVKFKRVLGLYEDTEREKRSRMRSAIRLRYRLFLETEAKHVQAFKAKKQVAQDHKVLEKNKRQATQQQQQQQQQRQQDEEKQEQAGTMTSNGPIAYVPQPLESNCNKQVFACSPSVDNHLHDKHSQQHSSSTLANVQSVTNMNTTNNESMGDLQVQEGDSGQQDTLSKTMGSMKESSSGNTTPNGNTSLMSLGYSLSGMQEAPGSVLKQKTDITVMDTILPTQAVHLESITFQNRIAVHDDEAVYSFVDRDSDYLSSKSRARLILDLIETPLEQSKLFKGVSPGFLFEMCCLARFEVHSPDDTVVSPECFFSCMYIVRKGSVHNRQGGQNASEGHSFNENSLHLNYKPDNDEDGAFQWYRPEGVFRSIGFSELWCIDRRVIIQAMALFPKDGEIVMANYLRHFNKRTQQRGNTDKMSKLAGMMSNESANAGPRGRRIFDTDSPQQVYWNHLMFITLMWTYITWPVQISFSLLTTNFDPADRVIEVLYLVDVFLRLCHFQLETVDGKRVSDPALIPRFYIRSVHGVFDMLAALPLEFIFLLSMLSSGTDPASVTIKGGISIIVLCRSNKLLRGARWLFHISAIGRNIKNQSRKSAATIAKLVFMLMLTAHWSGCFFYLVAVQNFNTGVDASWASTNGTDLLRRNNVTGMAEVDPNDFSTHYFRSLYFGVTTITAVGYGDITPISMPEVSYTIVVLLVGGLLYSVIITFLEDIVAAADLSSVLFQKLSDEISAMISLRGFPLNLRSELKQRMLRLWMKQKAVEDNKIMSFINDPLTRKIMLELVGQGTFMKSPVLGASGIWRYVLHKLEMLEMPTGEVVFKAGQRSDYLYLISNGTVELTNQDRSVTYATLDSGNCVGQDGFFRLAANGRGGGYHSCARTTRSSSMARLKLDDLIEVLHGNPHLHENFLSEHAKFVAKPSFLEYMRKNLDNHKLTKMLQHVDIGPEEVPLKGLDKYIMYPTQGWHATWHMVVFGVTCWNIVVVPLMLGSFSGDSPDSVQTTYYEVSRTLFFFNVFFDLLLVSHVGFSATIISRVHDGIQLKHSTDIRNAYLRSVFGVLDILATLPVDFLIFVIMVLAAGAEQSTMERSEWVWIAYTCRAARFYWLLYLSSWWSIADAAADANPNISIKSGYRHLLKIVFLVLLVSHWFTCGYMALLTPQMTSGYDDSFTESYANRLYVVVYTMTTVGYGNMSIETDEERFFVMIIMVVGAFLCDAGITSTMTSIVDVEDSSRGEDSRMHEAADRYLNTRNVGIGIKAKARTYFAFMDHKHGLTDESVLTKLSAEWQFKLMRATLMRAIGPQPEKCEQLVYFNAGMLRTLILNVESQIFMPDDIIFFVDEPIDRLVFVISGSIQVFFDVPSRNIERVPCDTLALEDNRVDAAKASFKHSPTAFNFSERNEILQHALHTLNSSDLPTNSAILDSPGLLLTNRVIGEMAKEIVVAKTVCEAWVCNYDMYNAIMKLSPPIGGFFNTMEEVLQNALALSAFKGWMRREKRGSSLTILMDIIAYKNLPANSAAGRKRIANRVVQKHFVEDAPERIEISTTANAQMMRSYKDGEPRLFDGIYETVLDSTKTNFTAFMKDPAFKALIVQLHDLQRQKICKSKE